MPEGDAECWISVDVEAAGPNPSTYSLLSLGACLVEDPSVGIQLEFAPVNDASDPAAMAVSGLSLDDLAARGLPPEVALARLESWLAEVVPAGRQPVFVGFNAPFDWMFVCDYFHRHLGRNPFGHSAIDIKALAMGVLGIPWSATSFARLAPEFLGERALSHDALADARDQAELVRALLVSRGLGWAG